METKVRFKMYKSGKLWLVAGVAVLGVTVTTNPTQVHGDELTTAATATSSTPVGASGAPQTPISAATSNAAPATSVSGTPSSAAPNSTASGTPSSATPSSTASVAPSSAVPSSTASVAPSSAAPSSTATSQAPSSVAAKVTSGAPKTVVKAPNVKPKAAPTKVATPKAQVSYQELVKRFTAVAPKAGAIELTQVNKTNFLDYFKLNGSATYDANTGIVTLTQDIRDQVGNFSLKSKIDLNNDFTLTGSINLGKKTSGAGGADGIAFALHTGSTDDVGNSGGNLGIGGLQNAIAFKLDTYHNDYQNPNIAKPGEQIKPNQSNGFGWANDPADTAKQFGAIVRTENR